VRDWPGLGVPLVHVPDPLRLRPSGLVEGLAALLAPTYRVLSVAPRAGAPYQVAAADLRGVLSQFGFLQPVLIGEGLGCLAVVILAAWYPERVGRLILVGPTYAAPEDRVEDGIEARALQECPPDSPALLRSVRCDVLQMPADDPALLERVEAFLATRLP
jgi:pimeloyl-ACP methyl ester carboxylesterase